MNRSITPLLILTLSNLPLNTLAAPSHDPEKKPEAEYWKNTGLTLATLERELLVHCNDTGTNVLACLGALNSLASNLETPLLYATPEEKSQNELGLGDLVSATAFGLNAYAVNNEDFTLKTEWLKAFKISRALHQTAAEKLKAKGATPFIPLIREVSAKILAESPDLNEAYLSALMMNSILEVTVDPHTHLTPTDKDSEERKGTADVYAGIGASISTLNKRFLISDFSGDSSAEASGMKVGDILLSIDGKAVDGMAMDKMIQLVRGPENTRVVVRVKRGLEELDIPVSRKIFRNENVESKLVHDAGTEYGYIKIRGFMAADTAQKTADAILALTAQGAKGFILDLRGNPGGDIVQAERVTSLFVGHRNTVSLKSLDGKPQADFMGEWNAITKLPMVTLINGSSASAAEIVSGALQDYQRSWVLGDRSFGKGSAQQVLNFDASKKIKISVTRSRFYQPSGRTNQIVGILPDFNIIPFPGATEEDRFALREEDLYSNALPEIGSHWNQPRPEAASRVNACRSRSGQADALYQTRYKTGGKKPDYRLFSAEDVLNCELGQH